jgi:hypothetical protein
MLNRGKLRGVMPAAGTRWRATTVALAVAALALVVAPGSEADEDPLAAEIARWSAFVSGRTSDDETWKQIKEPSQTALARARAALAGGRRLLALQRLASARADLSAWVYLQASPAAARKELAAFESEWKRMGSALAEDLGPPTAGRLEGVRPAAARALAEAALPQVRVFYEASLEYGRNTMPEYGLFYLGSAQAQRELVDLYRMLSAGPPLAAPPLRSLAGELAALEDELLALYRPPAAIDRHREFIGASAALKEARELEGLGLRYGALLRYLQAALRVAPLRPAAPAAGSAQLAERLRDLGARLAAAGVDHSLGRLFVEAAEAELTASTPAPAPANAPAIVADLLPRYLAALDPAKPAAARPEPQVTVTLVRWPYT